jgi:hypothetical protein
VKGFKSLFRSEKRSPVDRLKQERNAQKRGYKFEDLITRLLRVAKFEVRQNPKAARPRQTDLHASFEGTNLLIETKWTQHKLDVSVIDALRARLDRTPNVIGCIFSMSGFTTTAIQELENKRNPEIILFNEKEIETLCESPEEAQRLIKNKRDALRIDAKAWFLGQEINSGDVHSSARLPRTTNRFVLNHVLTPSLAAESTDFVPLMFTQHVPELSFREFGGHGVGLHLDVAVSSTAGLENFLKVLQTNVGLSSDGSFLILQSGHNWHGFGPRNLLSEIARWRARYKLAKMPHIHHSEDIRYFDYCDRGFLLLTARQSVQRGNYLYSCHLDIVLPGIPLDTRPYQAIAEAARDSGAVFSPLDERLSESHHFNPPVPIKPEGKVISSKHDDGQSVCALVVKNLFRNPKIKIPNESRMRWFQSRLSKSHMAVVNLTDWESLDAPELRYVLHNLHLMQIGDTLVLYPSGTWLSPRPKRHEQNFAEILRRGFNSPEPSDVAEMFRAPKIKRRRRQ